MNHSESTKRLETIERYVEGQLDIHEKGVFEQRLQSDSTLQKDIDEYIQVVAMFRKLKIENRVMSTLQQLERQETAVSKTIGKQNLWYRVVGTALAACLLFVLYISFDSIQLPDVKNDFSIVRDIDITALSVDEKKTFGYFYTGKKALTAGDFQGAIVNFQEFLKNKELRPYFSQAAKWHLILAYLHDNSPTKAQKLLSELDDENDSYPIGTVNKIKIRWQIFWRSIF